jgi:hypothetical protein
LIKRTIISESLKKFYEGLSDGEKRMKGLTPELPEIFLSNVAQHFDALISGSFPELMQSLQKLGHAIGELKRSTPSGGRRGIAQPRALAGASGALSR